MWKPFKVIHKLPPQLWKCRKTGSNKSADSIPFDWDSEWAKLYFGGQRHCRDLSYAQFPQMLRELQGECVRQASHAYDKNTTGFNEPSEFQRIPASVLPSPSS